MKAEGKERDEEVMMDEDDEDESGRMIDANGCDGGSS